MRIVSFVLLAIFLAALVPTVPAASAQGATVGVNLGFVQPGLWDTFYFNAAGGTATIQLSWAASVFPGADYDLRLYVPGALNDGQLTNNELIAHSSTRSFTPHTETITATLPPAAYIVAVVPWQTQAETYTLTTNTGGLQFAAIAPGFTGTCPPIVCPF